MKKNLTSVAALVCALLTLIIALFCLVTMQRTSEELSSRIAALEAQVAQLRNQTEPSDVQLPDISCNLLVDSWTADEGILTTDLFAVAQLEEGMTVSQAQLCLICGDQTQVRDIEMQPGEGENSFEANLPGFVFDLPEPESGNELILELITTCTGGRTIHARVNWYFEDGMLELVSG